MEGYIHKTYPLGEKFYSEQTFQAADSTVYTFGVDIVRISGGTDISPVELIYIDPPPPGLFPGIKNDGDSPYDTLSRVTAKVIFQGVKEGTVRVDYYVYAPSFPMRYGTRLSSEYFTIQKYSPLTSTSTKKKLSFVIVLLLIIIIVWMIAYAIDISPKDKIYILPNNKIVRELTI